MKLKKTNLDKIGNAIESSRSIRSEALKVQESAKDLPHLKKPIKYLLK